MSLVGLKNIFFRQTVVPERRKFLGTEINSSSPLLPDEQESDVESQNSCSTFVNKKKGFRIDARVISDATIGLSDGLTVPFALTAGLSALGNTKVVIYGGLAELIAGAISMGLGGYLGAQSELASYKSLREQAQELIKENPQAISADIAEVFEPYNFPQSILSDITTHLAESPKLVDFYMQFQHCTEQPASSRALVSAATIALGYFVGGLLPLLPYFCVDQYRVYDGLYISIAVMVVALFLFGYVKSCIVIGWNGGRCVRKGCFGGVQMVVVGSAAAASAMGLVRAFNHNVEGAVSGTS